MTYIPQIQNKISTDNSVVLTNVVANQVWTGTAEDVSLYGRAGISIWTPFINPCDGVLTIEVSRDGTNWGGPDRIFENTAIAQPHMWNIVEKYFRLKYTHGATSPTATDLVIQTQLSVNADTLLGHQLNETLIDETEAIVTRSVLVGADQAGNYRNVNVDAAGHIEFAIHDPLTAFGEVSVAENTPVAQLDFVYGTNNQMTIPFTTGSGNITSTDGMCVVSTSATINSKAVLSSSRFLKYRDGQGALGRFTAKFSTGVVGSYQYAGIGSPDLANGFFYGKLNDNIFGVIHKSNGSLVSFTPQTSWNIDNMDGSGSRSNPSGQLLDTSKGNVYGVPMQYLGFGAIVWKVENATTGRLDIVHITKYANSNSLPSVRNPSFNLIWAAENTTNNTNIVVNGASGALFVEGKVKFLGPKNGIDNNKSGITTLTSILALKNASSYNGINNKAQVRLRSISVAYDGGNGIGVLQLHKNATIGGTPAYATINGTSVDNGTTITSGNSVVSYDVAATTVASNANSYIVYNLSLARNTNVVIDITEFDIYLNPGDILTFACKATTSGVFSVSCNWSEDI